MQKFIQTAMFYLLVSVLIMMAGIIVGYLWSSDIGLWIHDAYYGGGVSVSTIFTVIGTAFTVLTFGLALKAYDRWKDQFILDRLQRTIDLSNELLTLIHLANDYSISLAVLIGTEISSNKLNREKFTCSALNYESQVIKINIYNYLLRNLKTDNGISFMAKDFSFGDLAEKMRKQEHLASVKSSVSEIVRIQNLGEVKIDCIRDVAEVVHREIDRLTNELPS